MSRDQRASSHLDSPLYRSLEAAWSSGVPVEASTVQARWWQLETWLRSLVYVELHAKYGSSWANSIPSKALNYASNEARLAYMSSPDASLLVSYIDVFDLFDLIIKEWDIFKPSLLDKDVWQGHTVELRQIRHRNAHCRRPHRDDLARLEQILRDLEHGAFRAISLFNDQTAPAHNLNDPLVDAWISESHPDASRLVVHAESHYEIWFRLTFSRRPWSDPYQEGEPISGRQGYLWHAGWVLHSGGLELSNLWNDYDFDKRSVKDRIVYVCADSPFGVDISFSAMTDPSDVANAIGNCFDAVINASRAGYEDDIPLGASSRWAQRAASLDPRIQVETAWATITQNIRPVTMFSAEGK